MATGQVHLDSYDDAGVLAAVELVNAFAVGDAFGRRAHVQDPLATIARILVNDPPSVAQLRSGDTPGFVALAGRLREVFEDVRGGDVDGAASRLNLLLAEHPAHPHLAKENGQWRLHHHPTDAALVPMYTSICAEGLARIIGAGGSARLGTCEGPACDRVYVDVSKNASRRFCSTACQNRVKAAAFRRRQERVHPRAKTGRSTTWPT